tara:strand:- start:621 stop:935 length:315 start_codon:yes stop_codon:yes gene_type:complete
MNNTQQRIQELAHQIWESEGKPHGHSIRHWETACKLVAAEKENHGPAIMKQLNESSLPGSAPSPTKSEKKTRKPKIVAEDETLLSVVPKTQKRSNAKQSKSISD